MANCLTMLAKFEQILYGPLTNNSGTCIESSLSDKSNNLNTSHETNFESCSICLFCPIFSPFFGHFGPKFNYQTIWIQVTKQITTQEDFFLKCLFCSVIVVFSGKKINDLWSEEKNINTYTEQKSEIFHAPILRQLHLLTANLMKDAKINHSLIHKPTKKKRQFWAPTV